MGGTTPCIRLLIEDPPRGRGGDRQPPGPLFKSAAFLS